MNEQIDRWINERSELAALNMNPDFQRGHVWTEEQQIAYVEFKLSGGAGSNIIYFNCAGWMHNFRGPFVLVDGKQRIEAVQRFLNNEIKVFGHYYSEFEDSIPFACDFIFCVNDISNYEDVLRWYIQMNAGGTPHTEEEINKVKNLLIKE